MAQAAPLKVADLSTAAPTTFQIRPDNETMKALATELGLDGLRKVLFTGAVAASGQSDWLLTGKLGVTVVQPCSVTLAPVTTRIDAPVRRLFVADMVEPDGDDEEMPEDDEQEPLGRIIDLAQIMAEALALAVPQYPRAEGAELDQAVFAEPGTQPLKDRDLKPFAGLAALKDRTGGDAS